MTNKTTPGATLVSVLMPNFNYGHYLAEAIESVIAQTFSDWELIVVDDGSTDNSVAVVESYVQKYPEQIKLIRNQRNSGLAHSYKQGVNVARGEYVAFLESDDVWEPESLARKIRVFRDYPDLAVVFSDVQPIGDPALCADSEDYMKRWVRTRPRNASFVPDSFRANVLPTFSVAMTYRRMLAEADLSVPRLYDPWTDIWLWFQLKEKGAFYFIPERLTKWRKHADSYLKKQKRYDYLHLRERIRGLCLKEINARMQSSVLLIFWIALQRLTIIERAIIYKPIRVCKRFFGRYVRNFFRWIRHQEPVVLAAMRPTATEPLLVMFVVDAVYTPGLWAVVRSVIRHTADPSRITFGILSEQPLVIPEDIQQSGALFDFRLIGEKDLTVPLLSHRIGRSDLNVAANLTQLRLPEYFPEWNWGIYLDTDMIVKTDIANLTSEFPLDKPLACTPSGATLMTSGCYRLNRFSLWHIDPETPEFQLGLMVFNMESWRKHRLYETRILPWIERDRQGKPLFYLFRQPLINLALAGEIAPLDWRWNMNHVGCGPQFFPRESLDDAFILHWSGNYKPWLPNGNERERWLPYAEPI